jgi:hypothetical protein
MAKPDHPALLQPGLHTLTLQQLHDLAVAPFPQDQRRCDLYGKLVAWMGAVKACGVSGTLWLDGSFLTEKPQPDDIDCVLWGTMSQPPSAQAQQLNMLLHKPTARSLYMLDVYVAPANDIHKEAYWKGLFGYCHDRVTAKGLAEVAL